MFLEKLLILLQIKNINKFALFFVLCLYSCSNFEFVYNNDAQNSGLSVAEIFVSGSGNNIIKKILSNRFLSDEGTANYKLSVSSKMETNSVVIENDQTASTVEIKYTLEYILFDYKKDCVVINENITSLSTYNSRAESYNFGSDLSKEQVNQEVIRDNINKFAYQINTQGNNLGCL